MTFLKALGRIIMTIIGLSPAVLPLIKQTVPGAAATVDKLDQSFSVIEGVEQVFTAAFGPDAKMGSDKLKAATPHIAALVQSLDVFSGKKPKNEPLFTDAVTRLTSAMADIFNSFGD